MRITTQMLNESARKAGLPINNMSLLNFVNKDSSATGNSLLDALNKNSNVNSLEKSNYEKLEKSAGALEQAASVLASEDTNNIFAEAGASGSADNIKKQVKEFVSTYNDVMKLLGSSSSVLNGYYKQMMEAVTGENETDLSSIGITTDKKGYLSLDEDKLGSADIDTLEQILGSKGSYSEKVSFIAEHAADNAETNLASISNQYSASGSTYTAYMNHKYDLWG